MRAMWFVLLSTCGVLPAYAGPIMYQTPGYRNSVVVEHTVTVTGSVTAVAPASGTTVFGPGGASVLVSPGSATLWAVVAGGGTPQATDPVVSLGVYGSNNGTANRIGGVGNTIGSTGVVFTFGSNQAWPLFAGCPVYSTAGSSTTPRVMAGTGTPFTGADGETGIAGHVKVVNVVQTPANGVTVYIAGSTGTSATVIVGNTISQGDVNNASKAANMGVTTFRDSGGNALGGGALMSVVGGDVNNAGKMQAYSATPLNGSTLPGTAQMVDLFANINGGSVRGELSATPTGGALQMNAVGALQFGLVNGVATHSEVSATPWTQNGGANGGTAVHVDVVGFGTSDSCTIFQVISGLTQTVNIGATLVIPSGVNQIEITLDPRGSATDAVYMSMNNIASACNASGRPITHGSSDVTAVAGSIYEPFFKRENLNIGPQGATMWFAGAGGALVHVCWTTGK